jgi:hypothetical protein
MPPSTSLTATQKRRIEKNKRKALELRAISAAVRDIEGGITMEDELGTIAGD